MNKKTSMSPQRKRERALFLYASALQNGDFDTVSALLKLAERDAILDQMLKDLDSLEAAPEARAETPSRPLQNGKGIQQNVIIRQHSPDGRPSKSDPSQEDTDMNFYTTFESTVPANPKTLYPFAMRFITLAAAILIVALVGGLLIEMVNDPIDGYPAVALQTETPKPCIASNTTDLNAESVRLATAATALLKINDVDRTPEMIDVARLLATCALRTAQTPEADLALQQALSMSNSLPTFNGAFTSYAPDGRSLLTTFDGSKFWLWDVATGEQIREFGGHTPDRFGNIAFMFSPDGRTLFTTGGDHTARLWDVETGLEIRRFPGDVTGRPESAAFTPDGKYVLAGGGATDHPLGAENNPVLMWDVATGEEVRRFVGHTQLVFSIAVSPDGLYLATTSYDGTARLWDMATGQELHQLDTYPSWTYGAAFSPDSQFLLSGGGSPYARLVNVQTGETVRELPPDTRLGSGAAAVAYSPDGRFVVTGGRYSQVIIWDAESGHESRVFTPGVFEIDVLTFSPDGQSLLIAGYETNPRIWPVTIDGTIALACSKTTRDFTAEERAQYGLGEGKTCP